MCGKWELSRCLYKKYNKYREFPEIIITIFIFCTNNEDKLVKIHKNKVEKHVFL
ncbi:hypothetical protein IMSAGC012_01432 [Lachnospiraceae bacterium]|jgi:hypothetical protein|nr:hypothetical protein IMSAGC012_01432 [Lachnospiraceae bacterium]